ncbi:MAG: nucleoside monophosphate kinase [Candidatus Paceibacterota bacterium]
MQKQTFVFLGPQGSGKGTQADQVVAYLRAESERETLYFETGAAFRQLAEGSSETSHHVRKSLIAGDIQPSFLAVRLWAEGFATDLNQDMHLVVDGSPRTLLEARMLDEAFVFYDRTPVKVIHLTLPESVTYERLAERARDDDHRSAIKRRLAEYQAKTLPVIDFYKDSDNYTYIQIDGEGTIDEIQQSIRDTISLHD